MTVITKVILQCQGKAGACLASLTMNEGTPTLIRRQAETGGWKAPQHGGKDLCPACAGPPPVGTCPTCRDHAEVEYRDALGHDGVGHRVANLLASHGVVTWQHLLDLSPPKLRKIKGLGQTGAGRIGWAQNNPNERPRT
jgi:hypothetical protein